MKFFIKDFFSKMWPNPQIWLHLLKKSFIENFFLCAADELLVTQGFFQGLGNPKYRGT